MKKPLSIAIRSLAPSILFAGLNLCVGSHAATFPLTIKVAPMPFNSDSPVTISATVAGPFQNATAFVSIRDGNNVLLSEQSEKDKGAIPAGQVRAVSIDHAFTVPFDVHSKGISVFVVFLEGDEQYVGEPGPDRSLGLSARCPARLNKTTRPICTYATGKYWAQTTKLK